MGAGSSKNGGKQDPNLLQVCDDHELSINCLELSGDGSVLATGSDDSQIRLWTTRTDSVECIGVLEGHRDHITSVTIVDNYLVSSSADKIIRKWDMTTCECVMEFVGHENTVNRVKHIGPYLISCSYDKTARIWDFQSGECIHKLVGHTNSVNSVLVLNTDGGNFVSDDMLNASTAGSKSLNGSMIGKKKNKKGAPSVDDMVNSLDISREPTRRWDEKELAITSSLDGTARCWSLQRGECIKTYRGHTGTISYMCLDKGHKVLFTGSSDFTIKSWDVFTGEHLALFRGHQAIILFMRYYKSWLYTASADQTIRAWATEFGECIRVFKGNYHGLPYFVIEDGTLFSACGDGIIRAYDAKSGNQKEVYKHHTGCVNGLKVVDDRLFSVSYDGKLCVWNVGDMFPERRKGHRRVKLNMKEIDSSLNQERVRRSSYDGGDSPVSDYSEPTRVNVREQGAY